VSPYHYSTYPNLTTLVVDNGSTDDTLEVVGREHPAVHRMGLCENLGFATGCNRGIAEAMRQSADYVLLLNNDTLVAPDLVEQLVRPMGVSTGVTAPKIYYAHDPRRIWSAGATRDPLTLEMKGSLRGTLDSDDVSSPVDRDYLVGCALLLSRQLLESVGGFDERFFMYYEDMDLCLRARKAGFRLLLVPQAKVWHKVAAASGGSDSPNERYWMARSSVIFFAKHARILQLGIIIPYRLGSMIKTLIRLAGQRRWASARAYVRGIRDGLRDVLTDGMQP